MQIVVLPTNASVVKLLQFTDLHFGENESLDGQTIALMKTIFTQEKPDFAVFTGDLVSGYAVFWSQQARQALWKRALSVSEEFLVPFATLFGNHDDQPYREDPLLWNEAFLVSVLLISILYVLWTIRHSKWQSYTFLLTLLVLSCSYATTAPSKSTRQSLVEFERQSFPTLSFTSFGPGPVHGTSNYRLILQHALLGPVGLYFLDSGGGRIPEDIHESQIKWLRSLPPLQPAMPCIAFVHISPFPADLYAGNSAGCTGLPPLEESSSVAGGVLLLQTLIQLNVTAVFMGHDHGNEWCCRIQSLLACYGKHSGFGGYSIGPPYPGARIIELYGNGSLHTRITHGGIRL